MHGCTIWQPCTAQITLYCPVCQTKEGTPLHPSAASCAISINQRLAAALPVDPRTVQLLQLRHEADPYAVNRIVVYCLYPLVCRQHRVDTPPYLQTAHRPSRSSPPSIN